VIEPKRARRPGGDDGIAVQAHRARKPHPAQHERAVEAAGAEGDRPRSEVLRNGSTIAARCWCAARAPAGEDRPPARVLDGYLIAYLNIDEVIRIIRTEDEPKPVMMAAFDPDRGAGRGDPQHAAAQLAQARGDRDPRRARRADQAEKAGHRGAARLRGKAVEARRRGDRGPRSLRAGDAARQAPHQFADAPERGLAEIAEALVEREPITVVVSEKGWIGR
jgi:hypothetical protein